MALSRAPLLALGAVVAVALTSCGGGNAKLLPGDTANEIAANLRQVRELANEGECIGAQNAAQAVSVQVRQLGGVDTQLKQALREGADRLSEVVAECEEAPEEAEEAESEESESPEEAEKPARPVKPEKHATQRESEEPAETTEKATPPPPAKEAEGGGPGEAPTTAPGSGGTPSGGVSPSAPVGGK
jgi:hypothetical protein